MQFEDLRKLCIAAAMDVVDTALSQQRRPVPPTMVVPGGTRTQLMTLTDFPLDDEDRHTYLVTFAQEQLADQRVPAWGFVVEAEINDTPAIVVVYGARKNAPALTAAPLHDDGLGDFVPSEDLDPTAMPFLHPLQHVVDSMPAEPADRGQGRDHPEGGLPLF